MALKPYDGEYDPIAEPPKLKPFTGDYTPTPNLPLPTQAAPATPDSGDGDFARGFKRTLPELKQLVGGTIAAAGDVTGLDSVRDYGLGVYKAQEDKLAPLQRPNDSASEAYKQVKQGNLGAGVDFLQNAAGYTAGQALESLAAAGAGAVAGGIAGGAVTAPVGGEGSIIGAPLGAIGGFVAKQGVKRLVKQEAEKLVAEQVAKGVAKSEAKKLGAQYVAEHGAKDVVAAQVGKRSAAELTKLGGKVAGGALGAQGLNAVMEVGSVYPDAYNQAQAEGRDLTTGEKAKAVGASLAAAGLETVADLFNLGVLFKGVKDVGHAAARDGLRSAAKAYAGRAAVAGTEGALREAGTEGAQTFLERVGANQSLDDADAIRDYVDSAAVGAVGGVLFGAGAAAHASHPNVTVKPLGKDPNDKLRAAVVDAQASGDPARADAAVQDLHDALVKEGRVQPQDYTPPAQGYQPAPIGYNPPAINPAAGPLSRVAAQVPFPDAQPGTLASAANAVVPAHVDPATGEYLPPSDDALKAQLHSVVEQQIAGQGRIVRTKAIQALQGIVPRRAQGLFDQVMAERKQGITSAQYEAANGPANESPAGQAGEPAAVASGGIAGDSGTLAGAVQHGAADAVLASPEAQPATGDVAPAQDAAPADLPAAGAQAEGLNYNTSDQLERDDLVPPSGEPYTHQRAAELQAAKVEGGRVFPVEGGYVVRVPQAATDQSAESQAAPAPSPASNTDSARSPETAAPASPQAAPTPAASSESAEVGSQPSATPAVAGESQPVPAHAETPSAPQSEVAASQARPAPPSASTSGQEAAKSPSPESATGPAGDQSREVLHAELAETRTNAPQVAQPLAGKSVAVQARTLDGPRRVNAKLYELPNYQGPQLAVARYKSGRGEGFRVYLPKSGVLVEDSNGVASLNDTLKQAVQRVGNMRSRVQAAPAAHPQATAPAPAAPPARPAPAATAKPSVAKTEQAAPVAGESKPASGAEGASAGGEESVKSIDERIAAAKASGVVLSAKDEAAIRQAHARAEEFSRRAGVSAQRGSDPMNKGNAFPMGVGFTKMTKRKSQAIDSSVKRAGEAVQHFGKAEAQQKIVDGLLAGKGTEADAATRATKKQESNDALMRKLMASELKTLAGADVVRVNKDRDGNPSTLTVSGKDIIKGVNDRIPLADAFGGKEALRASAARVRAEHAQKLTAQPASTTQAEPSKGETPAKPAPKSEAAGQASNPTAEESLAVAPAKVLSDIHALATRLRKGEASLEDYKAAWEALQANRGPMRDHLNTLKKSDLLDLAGPRYRNDPKPEVARAAMYGLDGMFQIGRTLTYGITSRDSHTQAMAALVEGTTQADLDKYAAEHAEARAQRDQRVAAAKDPQTLSEFADAARLAGGEANLTPDQRAKFDSLRADARREQRDAEAKRNAVIRQVDIGTTGMELVETKHTQKGHDLFVVKMADRVDGDTYKALNVAAKRLGGHYSSYRGNGAVPGFTFTARAAAEQFMAVREGNVDASGAQQARAEAKAENRAESLAEKAASLKEKAEASLNRERKDNTARRANMAANAEAEARKQLALADTMARLAKAIEAGKAKMLAFVRHKSQVELLDRLLTNAHDDHLRAQGVNWEKAKEEPIKASDITNAALPKFNLSRGDAIRIAQRLKAARGGKAFGESLAKLVDYGDEYREAVGKNPARFALGKRNATTGEASLSFFAKKRDAEAAIARSPDRAKLTVVKMPGAGKTSRVSEDWLVTVSPEEAIERKLWEPDYDKKITLSQAAAEKIIGTLKVAAHGDTDVPYTWHYGLERRQALAKLGIETNYELREALREYMALRQEPAGEDRVRKMERALVGNKAVGVDFFPTPPAVVQRVIDQADIQPGMRVLEPSAGKGDMAEAARDAAENVTVDTVEMSSTLREILEAKGFDTVAHDFMEHKSGPVYDRIVMNPPFGNDNGASHVQHAYTMLKPGGRLVAVMGMGQRGKEAFETWLDKVGGLAEPLPEGSFKSSFRPTGVATQVVVIDKPEGASNAAPMLNTEQAQELAYDEATPEQQASFARQREGSALNAELREAAAQQARDEGEADAKKGGYREAIARVLGPKQAARVKFSRGYEGLPENLRNGVESRNAERDGKVQTSALYDPDTQQVYLFTDVIKTADRAAFNAAHEIAGHDGLRKLLGPQLDRALEIALQNPAVRKLAEAIARDRHIDIKSQSGRLLAAEEALAELAAAVGTGDFDHIAQRYGVTVPEGMRRSVGRSLENFLARLKELLNDLFGRPAFTDEDVRGLLDAAREAAQGEGESVQNGPMHNQEDAGPFYSAALRAINVGKGAPKRGNAATWAGWLDGAVRRGDMRQSERDWLGLDDFIKGRGDVTRQELADFVRENQVQVKDVTLGKKNSRELRAVSNGDMTYRVEDGEGNTVANDLSRSSADDFVEREYNGDDTKFASYQLPGGENYRELLLTLPVPGGRPAIGDLGAGYKSDHFEHNNILAHVRFNDRTDASGKKVLFIEEIQSDWHQEGRKKGYTPKGAPVDTTGWTATLEDGWWTVQTATGDIVGPVPQRSAATAEEAIADQARDPVIPMTTADTVPDAPFKATDEWAMLAFKRMVREAAERGFDRIAWTTGAQQAERYDLSKHIDELNYNEDADGGTLIGNKDGVNHSVLDKTGVKRGDLADYVGKEMAERLLAQEPNKHGLRTLSGVGLKVGGEGMKGFYDKLLPAAVNKWAKRLGGKVGETQIKKFTDQYHAENTAALEEMGALPEGGVPNDALTVHSLTLTPAMREAAMQGQPLFNTEPKEASKPSILENVEPVASRNAPDVVADVEAVMNAGNDKVLLQRAKDKLAELIPAKVKDQLRPSWLAVLATPHLTELGSDYLPGMQHYDHFLKAMNGDRNELQQQGEEISEPIRQWGSKHPDEARDLFRLAHQATIDGVDPAKEYQPLQFRFNGTLHEVNAKNIREARKAIQQQIRERSGDSKQDMLNEIKALKSMLAAEPRRRAQYPTLQAKWNALSPEAQQHYVAMRDAYVDRSKMIEDGLVQRIEDTDAPENHKRKLVTMIRQQFETQRLQGVYFPLQRFGQYFVAATKGDTDTYLMFESLNKLEAGVKSLKAKGFTINAQGLKGQGKAVDAPSGTFVADVIAQLRKAHVSEATQDDIYQMYLQALPELSLRKHAIHRKAVPGFDPDAVRGFAFNMLHGAHQIARLRYAHKLADTITLLRAEQEANRKAPDADTRRIAAGDAILNELDLRHQWIMNPTDSKATGLVSSFGFLYYLGLTPAAALVNLTQTALLTFPYLAARHGPVKAMNHLLSGMADSIRTGGHIQKTLTDPDELAMHAELQRRGALDKTQAFNLAGIAEGGLAGHNPQWAKAMQIIGLPFHKAEVVNREASSIAAYRLARQEGMDHDQAVDAAARAVNDTHFDYTNQSRARVMQSGAAKTLLMFRQYSLNMTWHMGRMLWQATKNADPEVRTIARRNLAGVLGMSALFSGTLGLPMMSVTFGVLNAIAASFGSPDEPWDAETEFRAFLDAMFGKGAGAVIANGGVNALTGADIASRVSLSQLWFRDADRELDGRGAYYNLLEQAAGPMGGVLKNALVGKQMIDEGHTMRGIETMLPKALKDTLKAQRYATEGVSNLRGDPLVADVSLRQTLLQLAGFTPDQVASQYDVNRSLKNYEQAILDRRGYLLDAFAMALRTDDDEARQQVLEQIRHFNQTNPEIAITTKGIRQSLGARARYSRDAENGITLNRKLAARVHAAVGD